MNAGWREYLLLLFVITALYEFLKIFLYSRALVRESERIRREGRLIYLKSRREGPLKTAIERIILTGEPDEIYEIKNGRLIILHFLPADRKAQTADQDSFLAGIFFLLAEGHFHKQPLYAVFEYKKGGKSFRVENTDELRNRVIQALLKTRPFLTDPAGTDEPHRNHEEEKRCRNCFFRTDCAEALFISSVSSPARLS